MATIIVGGGRNIWRTFYFIRLIRPEVEIWRTVNETYSYRRKYRSLERNLGQGIECRCQNFHRKLIWGRFCVCAVNVIKNRLKCPYKKSTSRRTTAVTDLRSCSRLTWFRTRADSRTQFWRITRFMLMVQQYELQSKPTERGHGFQICGK